MAAASTGARAPSSATIATSAAEASPHLLHLPSADAKVTNTRALRKPIPCVSVCISTDVHRSKLPLHAFRTSCPSLVISLETSTWTSLLTSRRHNFCQGLQPPSYPEASCVRSWVTRWDYGLNDNVQTFPWPSAGGPSSGSRFDAAPNIDHSQPFVKKDLSEWMQWLREYVGFDGWRYQPASL